MAKDTNTTASDSGVVVEKVETQKVEEAAKVETTENVDETANDTELVEVEFLVSPTGKFSLAYNVGEVGLFPAEQAKELIELGYAKEVK